MRAVPALLTTRSLLQRRRGWRVGTQRGCRLISPPWLSSSSRRPVLVAVAQEDVPGTGRNSRSLPIASRIVAAVEGNLTRLSGPHLAGGGACHALDQRCHASIGLGAGGRSLRYLTQRHADRLGEAARPSGLRQRAGAELNEEKPPGNRFPGARREASCSPWSLRASAFPFAGSDHPVPVRYVTMNWRPKAMTRWREQPISGSPNRGVGRRDLK